MNGASDLTAATAELDVLFPEPVILNIEGKELKLLPLKFKEFKKALKLAVSMLERMEANKPRSPAPVLSADGMVVPPVAPAVAAPETPAYLQIARLISDNSESFTEFIALATGQTVEWVDGLQQPSALKVGLAVVEVNSDFFTRSVLPILATQGFGMGTLAQKMVTQTLDGPTP